MKETNTKSSSQGVRLSHETWPMLRVILKNGGRAKLEKWIAAHYAKITQGDKK